MNSSNNTNNESDTSIYPLDELLDSLGFLPINIYIYQIIIPIIASFGLITCLLSIWILYDKKFSCSWMVDRFEPKRKFVKVRVRFAVKKSD